MDSVFLTAPDLESLFKKIQEIEEITAAGGFKFKPWMVAGVDTEDDQIVSVASSDVEEALGMYWDVSKDEFFVRLDLSDAEKEILPSSVFTGSAGKNAPGPSSQGGLGEEGALVGTTTPSGPSSLRIMSSTTRP